RYLYRYNNLWKSAIAQLSLSLPTAYHSTVVVRRSELPKRAFPLYRQAFMLILDAHLDLAMNAMEWNRDLTQPLEEIRRREQGLTDKPDRGQGTVSLSEMRRGQIGLCVATQIARYVKPR